MSPDHGPASVVRLQSALDNVQAALARNDLTSAVAIAKTALASGLRHPGLLNLLAYDLEEQGRLYDSLAILQQALEMAPDDSQSLHAVGLCLAKLGRNVEAIMAFDAALSQRPGFAPTLHHMGVALESRGDDAQAMISYQQAADIDPGYPDPLAGLASVTARRGDPEEARRLARSALDLDPKSSVAQVALATADMAEQKFAEAEQGLAKLLEQPGLSAADRAPIRGLLADAFDAQDRCDEAYQAYVQSKAEIASSVTPSPSPETDFMQLAEIWTAALKRARRWPQSRSGKQARSGNDTLGGGAVGHGFLVGFPRSGTTLLEQVLDAHPKIVTVDERATLASLAEEFQGADGDVDRLLALDGAALKEARARYWTMLSEGGVAVEGKVLIDKLPLNTLRLPLIAKLFPEAKIIFALRDPRDVVWSCFRRTFRMNAAMKEFTSLQGAARFYAAVMTFAATARTVVPLDLHEVRYESLVENFQEETESVCRFLGLPWAPEMTDFAARAQERAIATPSAAQVRRGLYREGMGQWRRYQEPIDTVLPILEPWIEHYGYV